MTKVSPTPFRIQSPLDEHYSRATNDELHNRIAEAKKTLGSDLVILGHHYQRDEVIHFADSRGDSYKLARFAAENASASNVVFCGVHFMAESADILTNENQKVYLPDLNAGCSMADMATLSQVQRAWTQFSSVVSDDDVVPITYMNSSADIKAFVGEHDGAVCTSSNAQLIIEWGLRKGKHIFFIPDQHLGRNTAFDMGYNESDCYVYDPRRSIEFNAAQAAATTFWLWKGHCTTHQRFTPEHINAFRAENPDGIVVVHPETSHKVVEIADVVGSTEKIIDYVDAAPSGSTIGVATEVHLVQRLAKENPDKTVTSLDPLYCPCSTMFRIDLPHLAWCLENIVQGTPVNEISVDSRTRDFARMSLQKMLDISEGATTD